MVGEGNRFGDFESCAGYFECRDVLIVLVVLDDQCGVARGVPAADFMNAEVFIG